MPFAFLPFLVVFLTTALLEGQSKITDFTGRIAVRKGIKHISWAQELMQKDFVFVTPSLIGPALKETTALYHQIFGLHRAK